MEAQDGGSERLTPVQGLVRLNRLLFSDLTVDDVLDQIARLSQRTIPQADQVSVTLMDGDRARTVAFTGDSARQLDERQYDQGYGPCIDAAMSGRTIPVALRPPDAFYPDFSVAGQRLGILNTLSVALPVPDRVIGGINFYSHSEQPFDDEAVELAEVFASYAAVVLVNGASFNTTADFPSQMREAFRTRVVIETAKGWLMAKNLYSDRAAYEALQQRAAAEHRPLREVAQSILDGVHPEQDGNQPG